MADKGIRPMVNILTGEISYHSTDKHRDLMEKFGLDPSAWRVVREEPDRIFCIRRFSDKNAKINMVVLPKEAIHNG